ncbi:Subtilisin-like protease SBT3.6 [Linum perenne]
MARWRIGILVHLTVLALLSLAAISSSNVYIVYMGEKQLDDAELVHDFHHELLSNLLGSKEAAKESILYSYKHGFSGFAAVLTKSQARVIADFPGVVGVSRNRIYTTQTTRSWDFLNVNPELENGIASRSHSGAGSIVGVMDTGIWPESRSFMDDGMQEAPSRWKGRCQGGQGFNITHCNRKIIGARWYVKGYEAEFGKIDTSDGVEFLSPRDAGGHGTHTSSTATGSPVPNASYNGLAQGTSRGGAPSSWLAIYKVCWATGGCSSADILAGFDDAISDGVDVLSVSLGTSPPSASYVDDPLSIGSFHAAMSGIIVVCSGGNSGPYSQTVINTAPWVVTVAASSIDRSFPVGITLGNNQTFVGQGLYTGKDLDEFHPIVYGESIAAADADADSARSCDSGSLDAALARGKVILCFQSRSQRSVNSAITTVEDVEASGLIFARLLTTKDVSSCYGVPCAQVDFTIGTSLLTYIGSNSNPMVKFSSTRTSVDHQTSREVALFSSRGPSSLSPAILKPDIAGPGVNILASWSPAGSFNIPLDFKIESGTSMSCPHISGIVALIKAVHPTWSPAAIKSALITTASTQDQYGQTTIAEGAPEKHSDPFDYGGGHVDPNKAIDPGLVYDMGPPDYIKFLCAMGYNSSAISQMTMKNTTQTQCHRKQPASSSSSSNILENLNLPSITIPELRHNLTVTRTVTNVGPVDSIYIAKIHPPSGVYVTVKPSILVFDSSTNRIEFRVTFCSKVLIQGRYSFGELSWEDSGDDSSHVVRIPLVVRTVTEYS